MPVTTGFGVKAGEHGEPAHELHDLPGNGDGRIGILRAWRPDFRENMVRVFDGSVVALMAIEGVPVTAVPEPSTIVLGLFGVGMIVARRKRRSFSS